MREIADIYDPKDINPDILNIRYNDRAPLFGLEFSYRLKGPYYDQKRLVFEYVHENLKKQTNKWRFGLGLYRSGEVAEKKYGWEAYWISGLIEFVHWHGGRKDWFIVIDIGGIL